MNRSRRRRELAGIADQVVDGLREPQGIAENPHRSAGARDLQRQARVRRQVARIACRLLDERAQVERLMDYVDLADDYAREVEQAGEEPGHVRADPPY